MTLLKWVDIESNNYQIRVVEDGRFCKLKANGMVNYRATLFALVRLVCDHRFDSDYKIIIDFENTDFDFSNNEITGLIKYIVHLKEFYANHFAIVLPREESSMSSLLISRCEKSNLKVKFFFGSSDVDKWLV